MHLAPMNRQMPVARKEWFLFFSAGTCAAFLLSGPALMARLTSPPWLAFISLWLFAAVLGSALSVVRHADRLAHRLGEPIGTLILTLSVTFIEVVSISAIMLHGENNPTLARDTLFAVVMIVLNGMVGLSLLLGGWRHSEQHYNLRGANFYIGLILPLVTLSLVLPNFTQTTAGPTLSVPQEMFLVAATVGLYAVFLVMQTGRHHGYFADEEPALRHTPPTGRQPLAFHAAMLVVYLVPVVFLAEQFAQPVDFLIETLHEPPALAGVIMAVLVATPEAIAAVRAAVANHMQRSINIFLGSVLSTIGLTIPAIVLVGHFTGREIILGVEHSDLVMLPLTLVVSIVTFGSGRTTVMQGAVHLVLFAAYLMLIVQS